MAALADVRILTSDQIRTERAQIKQRLNAAGVSIERAHQNPYALTASQYADIEEYDNLGWLLNPDAEPQD